MNELLEKARIHVHAYVREHFPDTLTFHDIMHMEQTAQAAKELGEKAALGSDDALALCLAAWFHDIAYHLGIEGHEGRSAVHAKEFLRREEAPSGLSEKVQELILSTSLATAPPDLLGRLLRDAGHSFMGKPDFAYRVEALRKEIKVHRGQRSSRKEWLVQSISMLEQYSFLTAEARALWDAGRAKNLAELKHRLEKQHAAERKQQEEKEGKKLEKDACAKLKSTQRGIETLFRVAMNNHMRLSQIADRKSNLMLRLNALIISVLLVGFKLRPTSDPAMYEPLAILLLTCAISIITATLATMPKVTHGRTSKQAITERKANLLFFGNFHKMSVEEYEWGMKQVLNDYDFLYGSLTRDLYSLGVVLNRKYSFLHVTYLVFMLGLVATVVLALYLNDVSLLWR